MEKIVFLIEKLSKVAKLNEKYRKSECFLVYFQIFRNFLQIIHGIFYDLEFIQKFMCNVIALFLQLQKISCTFSSSLVLTFYIILFHTSLYDPKVRIYFYPKLFVSHNPLFE